jgi:hypothetical protein
MVLQTSDSKDDRGASVPEVSTMLRANLLNCLKATAGDRHQKQTLTSQPAASVKTV